MLTHIETIPSPVRSSVETYFTQLIQTFASKIDSIYLYGSIVTPDFQPKQSDINSLVLFDSFSSTELHATRSLVREGLKKRIVAPLCLSVETFQRSADTFPLEFIEIQDKHICLFGEKNRVVDLLIPREYLRVKIEEQIKGKLIRLRQVFMEHQGLDRELVVILTDAQKQLFPVFRNLLRFLGIENPPVVKDLILQELENRTQFALLPCRLVWEQITGRTSITGNIISVYVDYLEVLLKLAKIIDRIHS